MIYVLQVCRQLSSRIRRELPSWSCSKPIYKPVWHIPLLCLQRITPDDGQRNCPKHVEFHFQNKFEKLVQQVGFITRKQKSSGMVQTAPSLHRYYFTIKLFTIYFINSTPYISMYIGEHPQIEISIYPFQNRAAIVTLFSRTLMAWR
jgi:hypothetical protein